jgi:hypothetical protein
VKLKVEQEGIDGRNQYKKGERKLLRQSKGKKE